MSRSAHLDRLTDRWRRRHDAARPVGDARPVADPEREGLARRAFPFTELSPATYVTEHGDAMIGFTYDEVRYADPRLDAWLVEVGRLLAERRRAAERPR